MNVLYRGFKLSKDQVDRLLSLALDQLIGQALGPKKKLGHTAVKRRGGRAPMSAAERKAASKRMSDMWKKRRAQGKEGRLNT